MRNLTRLPRCLTVSYLWVWKIVAGFRSYIGSFYRSQVINLGCVWKLVDTTKWEMPLISECRAFHYNTHYNGKAQWRVCTHF